MFIRNPRGLTRYVKVTNHKSMSNKHYDIAIIGGSLSARIAAALLAKQGSSVLFLRYREATASEWFHSSLFLEKLLGTLGGRSCFVAQKPIQVISRKARVTLNNDISLDMELGREFGKDGPAVARWLEELRVQGVQLENLFWDNGGLPWPSLKTTASFKLLSLRRKVSWADLDAPLADSLREIPPSAIEFVTDLLQGLALEKADRLSRAQAALLWSQATRPENLVEPDFSQLLAKRFTQFHGAKADLDDLEVINYDGSRWTGGRTRCGGQFTARHFLLGDTRWVDRFKPGRVAELARPQGVSKMTTSPLTGQLSPLLASRLICGGEAPLRLAIEEYEAYLNSSLLNEDKISDEQLRDQLDHQTRKESEKMLCGLVVSSVDRTEEQLREQLEPVLPFAKYELSIIEEDFSSSETPVAASTHRNKLAKLPLQLGKNLFCADSSVLLPEMGASGAALLGWTLAENLADKTKPGSK